MFPFVPAMHIPSLGGAWGGLHRPLTVNGEHKALMYGRLVPYKH